MRRWIALACLAALISGCTGESSSDVAVVASGPAEIDVSGPGGAPAVTYVEWKDTGFTVIKSATADELFHSVATCTSHEGGYTVEYPVSWHTNEGGEAPGCSWFGPEPFARAPATLVAVSSPLDVPVQLSVARGGLPQVDGPRPPLEAQVVIGGMDGYRTEAEIGVEPPWWRYAYSALLGPTFDGLRFIAETTSAWEDEWRDYVLNKAVLDRMMATLEFTTGEPPPSVVLPTPSVTYVEHPEYPIPVIESAEADALFVTPDTCTNPVAGYTVTYPDVWYTNTEIGDWPACTWFSPSFYEVAEDPDEVPAPVAIVLVFGNVSYGYTSEPDLTNSAQVSIEGFSGYRAELVGMTGPNGQYEALPPTYFYTLYFGEPPASEPTLRGTTNFEGSADYVLNKAVLDRIMALIEFDER
jgi:hypothetical protein